LRPVWVTKQDPVSKQNRNKTNKKILLSLIVIIYRVSCAKHYYATSFQGIRQMGKISRISTHVPMEHVRGLVQQCVILSHKFPPDQQGTRLLHNHCFGQFNLGKQAKIKFKKKHVNLK
jgi:hypothetical protein